MEASAPGNVAETPEREIPNRVALTTLFLEGNYGFSRKFGWFDDRYCVSWQVKWK
jgi:predicted 3-demethylubiquinone-9 3-methyltransferase (glyoxalase superfamily)